MCEFCSDKTVIVFLITYWYFFNKNCFLQILASYFFLIIFVYIFVSWNLCLHNLWSLEMLYDHCCHFVHEEVFVLEPGVINIIHFIMMMDFGQARPCGGYGRGSASFRSHRARSSKGLGEFDKLVTCWRQSDVTIFPVMLTCWK
jgi:hypothetical protein